MISELLRRIRAAYRRRFDPEPHLGLDGLMIGMYMTDPKISFEEALAIRKEFRAKVKERWLNGTFPA